MCARPRRISDEEIFAAVMRTMSRLPPSELTLAAIGGEAGVTAGALVQRFGSKRGLILALARKGAEAEANMADQFLAEHRSPLKALEAFARCMTSLAESPAAFQRGLAYLQQDLADPELHQLLARQTKGNRAAVAAMLIAARRAGELRSDADTTRLAAMIEALIVGGMMSWAFHAKGSASSWVQGLLRDALAPYRPAGGRRRESRSPP
jgi:AcrR family transcriptional regulator